MKFYSSLNARRLGALAVLCCLSWMTAHGAGRAGFVGGKLLCCFPIVIFDQKRRRLILERGREL